MEVEMASLPDAVLELVFAAVCFTPQQDRRQPAAPGQAYTPCSAVPLVCRRWNKVYSRSKVLWSDLEIPWDLFRVQQIPGEPLAPAAAPDSAAGEAGEEQFGPAVRWLTLRGQTVEHLRMLGCGALGPTLLARVLAPLAGGACRAAGLDGLTGSADAALAALSQAPALQSLSIAPGLHGELTASLGALAALSSLSALDKLQLRVDRLLGPPAPELPAALAGLSELRLAARREAAMVPPELLEGMRRLRRLGLTNCRLAQFTPAMAEALKHLTHLATTDVLAARPRRKAGLQFWEGLRHLAALRHLQMEEQHGADLPANALACTGLQSLSLAKCTAGVWPSAADLRLKPVATLRSLALSFVTVEAPINPQFWASQAASLTELKWQGVVVGSAEENPLRPRLPPLPIPDALALLTSLVRLRLDYAGLEEVPACVAGLPRLRRLSLAGNRLRFEAAEGACFPVLEAMNLAGNQLAQLPPGLAACRALRLLSLTRNPGLWGPEAGGQELEALHSWLPHLEALHVSPGGASSAAGGKTWAEKAREAGVPFSVVLGEPPEEAWWSGAGSG